MRYFYYYLFGTLLLFTACTKVIDDSVVDSDSVKNETITSVIVPEGFDYATSKTITVNISSSNFGVESILSLFLVDDNGNKVKLTSGVSDKKGNVKFETSIPTYIDNLYITKNAVDLEWYKIVSVNTNEINVDFDVLTNLVPTQNTSNGRKTATCNDYIYAVNNWSEFFSINLDDNYAITNYPNTKGKCYANTYDQINDIIYYDVKGNLYSYDKDSGVSTLIASLNTASANLNDGYPRMVINPYSRKLFIAADTDFAIIDPTNGSVIKNATIQGIPPIQNKGRDFDFSSDGTLYQVSSGGLFRMDFNNDSSIITGVRLSAENFPYYLTGVTIDRFDKLYASTNDIDSKLIQMDIKDGSFVVLKSMGRKMTDLSSFRCTEDDFAGQDADNDGVVDGFDLYPNDSTKAFETYTPGENGYGTFAFEDLYPQKGDYDFNDLIVHYRYTAISNSQNKIVEFKMLLTIKTVQSDLPSGFGIELPIHADSIASVVGSKLLTGITSLNAKGLESGINDAKPVVIAFDNHFGLISNSGDISKSEAFEISITFNQPIESSSFLVDAFNPFIFINKDRTKEVHLANGTPTEKYNTELRNGGSDNGNYKTTEGHPWGLHLPHKFHPPKESIDITNAYSNFKAFVESSGAANKNWYTDDAGNRELSKIHLDN